MHPMYVLLVRFLVKPALIVGCLPAVTKLCRHVLRAWSSYVKLTLVKRRQATHRAWNKEMNQSELDKPCHLTRKFLETSHDDYIIYQRLGMLCRQEKSTLNDAILCNKCKIEILHKLTQNFFPSVNSSLGTNITEMHFLFKLSTKMHWTVPYDSPTISQTSWLVCLWSSRIAWRTFAMFFSGVLVDGRPECSLSSTASILEAFVP